MNNRVQYRWVIRNTHPVFCAKELAGGAGNMSTEVNTWPEFLTRASTLVVVTKVINLLDFFFVMVVGLLILLK